MPDLGSIYVGYTIWQDNDGFVPLSVWAIEGSREEAVKQVRTALIDHECFTPGDDDEIEAFVETLTFEEDDEPESKMSDDIATTVEEWHLGDDYVVIPRAHLRDLYRLWYTSHAVSWVTSGRHAPKVLDRYHEAHFEASRSHSEMTKAFATAVYDEMREEHEQEQEQHLHADTE